MIQIMAGANHENLSLDVYKDWIEDTVEGLQMHSNYKVSERNIKYLTMICVFLGAHFWFQAFFKALVLRIMKILSQIHA